MLRDLFGSDYPPAPHRRQPRKSYSLSQEGRSSAIVAAVSGHDGRPLRPVSARFVADAEGVISPSWMPLSPPGTSGTARFTITNGGFSKTVDVTYSILPAED